MPQAEVEADEVVSALMALVDAGLVHVVREGASVRYALTPDADGCQESPATVELVRSVG